MKTHCQSTNLQRRRFLKIHCTTKSDSMMPVSDACTFTENDTQHQEGQQMFCQQIVHWRLLQKREKKKRKKKTNKTMPAPTKSLRQPSGITVCQKLKTFDHDSQSINSAWPLFLFRPKKIFPLNWKSGRHMVTFSGTCALYALKQVVMQLAVQLGRWIGVLWIHTYMVVVSNGM